MKILHTSDWHLGRNLYGHKRTEEFNAWITWLIGTIRQEKPDLLIIAGDIFDSTIVSNETQKLYYNFLHRIIGLCPNTIVTSGNHDSASFLDAPSDLLKQINVHVIGHPRQTFSDEVIVIHDQDGLPQAIVCAVPFLHDAEAKMLLPPEERSQPDSLRKGIKCHYDACLQKALEIKKTLNAQLPIIAVGHLMVAGGITLENDGVREIYVGTLEGVTSDIFDNEFDYVALGHLHVPQSVGKSMHIQYSGSPIPMGFAEANQQKHICKIEFNRTENNNNVDVPFQTSISYIDIPCFQKLKSLRGELDELLTQINLLKDNDERIWIETIYTGKKIIPNLTDIIQQAIDNSKIELLNIQNRPYAESVTQIKNLNVESLNEVNHEFVFNLLLEKNNISGEEKDELLELYKIAVSQVNM